MADVIEVGVTRRQVFDLPEIAVRVTEHQLIARHCGCGRVTCGVAPDGVDAPVSYGPRVAAIIVCLYLGQFVSKKRTAQALAELFGTPVSAATVASTTRRAAAGLGGFRELVRGAIAAAEDQADHVCVVVESLMAASRLARSANVGTGTERGTYRVTNTEIWSSTVVDRGYRVYFGGQDGHVYGVSPGDVVLLDVDLGAPIDSYPALSGDGMLIVGAANGTLAAIG